MNCRRCGMLNAEEKEFCRQCGASLHWLSVTGPVMSRDRQGMVGLAVGAMGLVFGLILIYFPPFPAIIESISSSPATVTEMATPTALAPISSGSSNAQATATAASRLRTPVVETPPAGKPGTAAAANRPAGQDSRVGVPLATPTAAAKPPIQMPSPPPEITAPAEEGAPAEVAPDGEEPADLPPEEAEEVPADTTEPADLPADEPASPSETAPPDPAPDSSDVPIPEAPSADQAMTTYLNLTTPVFTRGSDSFMRFADQWDGDAGFAARLAQDPANPVVTSAVRQAADQSRNDVNAAITVLQQRQPLPALMPLRTRLTQALTGARGALLAASNATADPQTANIAQATQLIDQAVQDLTRGAAELDSARSQLKAR